MAKRLFDLLLVIPGLLILAPLLVLMAALVKFTSPGPALFRQERIGRGFRPFFIYKFRSMVQDAPRKGTEITYGNDPRITPVGRFLRKSKIDELPQLLNVLKGDMSLVGPRPEVRRYVEMFRDDYAEILQVRPGITDLASIEYRDEAAVLGHAANPEEEYIYRVLPEKIRLAKEYVHRQSVWFDIKLIALTFLAIVHHSSPTTPDNTARL